MNTGEIIAYILTFTATTKYLLLFIGVILEGPVLMVASGFMLHLGVFEVVPLFTVLIFGDLTGDVFWYYIGYHYVEKALVSKGKIFGITRERFEKARGLFSKYHEGILFISKITIGFGMALATLMIAGATKVPFKKYMILNFLGEIVLVAMLLLIGFLFAEASNYIAEGLKVSFTVGAIALAGFGLYGFSGYVKRILTK